MKDIMVDIETLGTEADAAVLSIGAVQFDRNTGALGAEFYTKIKFEDAVNNGRVDISTLKWWIAQSEEAGEEAVSGTDLTANAVAEFINFMIQFGPDVTIWGNGATFDPVILDSLIKRADLTVPWKHWNVRDCRTIEDLVRWLDVDSRKNYKRTGVHHSALDDAKYQAEYISGMLGQIAHLKD